MLTREQEGLISTVISCIKNEKSIASDIMRQILVLASTSESSRTQFRNFIVEYVAPMLTDKQLFELTKSAMTEEPDYLLRVTSALSGELYMLFAKRINYDPLAETQPDSMAVLNKLVYNSISKDTSVKDPKKGTITGITFKFSSLLMHDKKVTPEEAADNVRKFQGEAKSKTQNLAASFMREDTPEPKFAEGRKNIVNLDTMLDLKNLLRWQVKELADEIVKIENANNKAPSASSRAAAKILIEASKVVNDMAVMQAMEAQQVKSLLSAISTAVVVLKNPKDKTAIEKLRAEAAKNTLSVSETISSALSSFARLFKWNNKTQAKASNEGVFKHSALAEPLAAIATEATAKLTK